MRVVPSRRQLARLTTVVLAATLAACGDDPASPIEGGGDPENVSRVTVTLTPTGGGTAQSSVIVDPDGSQLPLPPNAATGTLALTKGVTYSGRLAILNDLDPKDIVDIAAEIKEEANFHRFFYTVSCAGVTVPDASLDLDTQSPTPAPLGLTFQVVVAANAGSTTSCTLRVELRHFETNKGNGLGSVFDTDLSLTFPVIVQ